MWIKAEADRRAIRGGVHYNVKPDGSRYISLVAEGLYDDILHLRDAAESGPFRDTRRCTTFSWDIKELPVRYTEERGFVIQEDMEVSDTSAEEDDDAAAE